VPASSKIQRLFTFPPQGKRKALRDWPKGLYIQLSP
jgi:hypothetical protein